MGSWLGRQRLVNKYESVHWADHTNSTSMPTSPLDPARGEASGTVISAQTPQKPGLEGS